MHLHRLSLSSEVDLKKLRFFTVVDDGGSPWTSPVDKQLVEAQRKARGWVVSNNAPAITLNKRNAEAIACFSCLQVIQQLETDLGVKVKEMSFPQLKYSYQIWDTCMALPDKDGKVCF